MIDSSSLPIFAGISVMIVVQLLLLFLLLHRQVQQRSQANLHYDKLQLALTTQIHQLHIDLQQVHQSGQHAIHEKMTRGQLTSQQLMTETMQHQMADVREQMSHSFKQHAGSLTSHLQTLTEEIRNHLHSLTQQVNHRLTEGFEKTSSTFTDVVRRLTIIDEAQKQITELSSHVMSLQDVLIDKRARGAFGEVQLSTLLSNMLPSNHYSLQHTLSNNKRADCVLFMPEPTGNIVIDAKFPLETYQKLMNTDASSADRKTLQQQFRQDLQKHITEANKKIDDIVKIKEEEIMKV